jgi:hypothetical protein
MTFYIDFNYYRHPGDLEDFAALYCPLEPRAFCGGVRDKEKQERL